MAVAALIFAAVAVGFVMGACATAALIVLWLLGR